MESELNGFTHSELDKLPFPCVITDASGKVLFKNVFSRTVRLVRKNSSILKLLDKRCADLYSIYAEQGISHVFECKSSAGVSHAITLNTKDGDTLVLFTVCSLMIRTIFDGSLLDIERMTFCRNELIISFYRKMCDELRQIYDPKADSVLKNNSLRFYRAARHLDMYFSILRNTLPFEDDELCRIDSICGSLASHISTGIVPLGYRFNMSICSGLPVTMIRDSSFMCVFAELAALTMKHSSDRRSMLFVSEIGGKIKLDFRFNFEHTPYSVGCISADIEFIRLVCNYYAWNFSGLVMLSDTDAVISFSIPVKTPCDITLRSPTLCDLSLSEMICTFAEEAISTLFFA